MVRQLGLIALIGFFAAAGCARYKTVDVHEGGMDAPYKSLGYLEVNIPARSTTPADVWWKMVGDPKSNPTIGDLYENQLNERLSYVARTKYDADAVINVEYWPDSSSKTFPDGMIHARGEMVRLIQFPDSKHTISEPVEKAAPAAA